MIHQASNISVIICAYTQERLDKLRAAVQSIQEQTLPAQEIIVVIDHNPELLRQARATLPDAQVIENTESQGLSGARNSGIARASGDLIAFLDDDARAEPEWLRLLQTALSDTQVLGAGTAVLPDWQQQEPEWLPAEFYWIVGCTYRGMPRTRSAIRNPIGASMCIRRSVFETVGGFHNGIGRIGTRPIGCEETELCIRALQQWPECYFAYLPDTHVAHYVPQTRASWHYYASRCYSEGISKAAISRLVGTRDSLSSESTYTMQTLPRGVLRNLGLAIRHGRLTALQRAMAIIAGLGMTTVGYLVGKFSSLSSTPERGSAPTINQEKQRQEILL